MEGNNGPVRNQFVITGDDGSETFQSYRSAIVRRDAFGKVTLDRKTWDYSTTTGKYRNRFLGESKADTERKIKSGEYELVDLNG
jgi:ABC-type Fe3+ transport system substrate-binding protein